MRSLVAVAGLAFLALTACPPQGASPPPPPPTEREVAPPPDPRQPPPPAPDNAGEPCEVASDCTSGICEGQGCAERQGVCAPSGRMCTMDLVSYCGCDGVTFQSSSGCAGRRFASRGECPAASGSGGKKADGAACLEASECGSGVCEGQGCGPNAPGVCAPRARGCTKDLRPYCGCDGKTFSTSGSCPGRRYSKLGACG